MSKQCQCNELRSKLAEMTVRYNNDKNTFYKSLELDGALREIRTIAREAGITEIVDLVDQVLGKEHQKAKRKEEDRQIDLYEVI